MYTGGYAVFKDLTQRLGDVASQISAQHGPQSIQVVNEEQVAASADNLDDLTEQERVRIQSFNESYATVGADANLISQFAEDAAKVKEAEEAAAAKRARTERLRKLKPGETMRTIDVQSHNAAAKRRRLAIAPAGAAQDEVQKQLDKCIAIAESLDSAMRAWLSSSFSDDMDDFEKTAKELRLDTLKSLRDG